MPVIVFVAATAGTLVKLDMVLVETLVFAPEKFTEIPVMLPAPVVTLLMVLPVIILVGPLELLAPLASIQPTKAVAPVKVMLEKLFPVCVIVDPFTDESPPPFVKPVTVPPAAVLAKPVTIEL